MPERWGNVEAAEKPLAVAAGSGEDRMVVSACHGTLLQLDGGGKG
jgi:hypothetical protein